MEARRAAPSQSLGDNEVQQNSQRNGEAEPPGDSLEGEFTETRQDAVGCRGRRADDSLAQPGKWDKQGQLKGREKLVHQLERRRVQSKRDGRQQTEDGGTTVHWKRAQ